MFTGYRPPQIDDIAYDYNNNNLVISYDKTTMIFDYSQFETDKISSEIKSNKIGSNNNSCLSFYSSGKYLVTGGFTNYVNPTLYV